MTTKFFHGLAVILLVLGCGKWQAAHAVEVTGLYQTSLPVESREDQKQRARAFTAGLQEVLVKLTGHADIVAVPDIQEALKNAQSYVEGWTYQTRPDPRTQQQRLVIDISFYQAGIQRMLDNAGIGLWPQTRTETVVWLIIQDEKDERVVADSNAGTGLLEMQALNTQAAKFGLPGRYPAWDMEDQDAMPPDLLWMQDEAALRAASSRYQYDSILAIRVIKLVTGQVVAKSLHLFRDHVQATEVLEGTLDDFLKATASMVARELSDNYAVRTVSGKGVTSSESQLLLLSVDGVHGLNDYANVLHYVQSLAGISEVHVREARADTLTFSLNAAGQVRQLVENLAIDRKLQVAGKPAADASSSHLYYRWQSQ